MRDQHDRRLACAVQQEEVALAGREVDICHLPIVGGDHGSNVVVDRLEIGGRCIFDPGQDQPVFYSLLVANPDRSGVAWQMGEIGSRNIGRRHCRGNGRATSNDP